MLKSLKSNATESVATHGACCTLSRGGYLWQGALPGGRVQRIGNRIAKIRVALGQVQFVMVALKIELQAVRGLGGPGALLHSGARALGKGIQM